MKTYGIGYKTLQYRGIRPRIRSNPLLVDPSYFGSLPSMCISLEHPQPGISSIRCTPTSFQFVLPSRTLQRWMDHYGDSHNLSCVGILTFDLAELPAANVVRIDL